MSEAAASAADLLSGGDDTQQQQQQSSDQQQQQQQQPDTAWLDAIDDPELKGWAQNKAYPSVKELAAAHRGLETLLGGEKLPLPKDENDTEGWDRVHKALGRPEEPAGYGLDKLEGADPEFATAAAEAFHKAGIGAKQAQALAGWWNEQQAAAVQAHQEAFQAQSRADLEALQKDWGANFQANTELGRRGAKMLGWDRDTMGKVEQALGTKGLMSMLHTIGGKIAEDSFEGDGGSPTFGMSVDQARARLNTLQQDKEWTKRYINGGAAERGEMEKLNRIIAGSPAQ